MRTATVAEAKERLEELIAAARAGETVEIIDRDDSAVTLVAANGAKRTGNSVMKRLQSDGIIAPAKLPADGSVVEELPDGASGVLDEFIRERHESW